MGTRVCKGCHKEYICKIILQKSIMFLKVGALESQNKDILFEYFPRTKFELCHLLYMKRKLEYSLLVLHVQLFADSLEFQANQENIHLT